MQYNLPMTKEGVIESVSKILDPTYQDENAERIRRFIVEGEGEITEENFYPLAEDVDLPDASNMLLAARRVRRVRRSKRLGVFSRISKEYADIQYEE